MKTITIRSSKIDGIKLINNILPNLKIAIFYSLASVKPNSILYDEGKIAAYSLVLKNIGFDVENFIKDYKKSIFT